MDLPLTFKIRALFLRKNFYCVAFSGEKCCRISLAADYKLCHPSPVLMPQSRVTMEHRLEKHRPAFQQVSRFGIGQVTIGGRAIFRRRRLNPSDESH
jgi:hypothetical protein